VAPLTAIERAFTSAVLVAALAVSVAACGGGLGGGRIYRVPSGAMEPTLKIGDRVIVAPLESTPRISEIVVFHPPRGAATDRCGRPVMRGEMCPQPLPKDSSMNFVKRIVAGPGDRIYLKDGHVYRKPPGSSRFAPETDIYIRECQPPAGSSQCTYPRPIMVPAGHWFMLGDNRGESDDSRLWGPVPTAWLVGVVKM
jgi:signal peptidase I